MNRIIHIASIVVIALLAGYVLHLRGEVAQAQAQTAEAELKHAQTIIEANDGFRRMTIERERLEGEINEKLRIAEKSKADALADVRVRHQRELERVRNRPDRAPDTARMPSTSADQNPTHPATGAELSRQDAEFLIGEAARADSIALDLILCRDSLTAQAPREP